MTYDQTQLQKDLSNIVWQLGRRQQNGFFTEGVYEDVHIQLVDRYIAPVEIYVNGMLVDPTSVLIESFTGHHILKLAIKVDERDQSSSLHQFDS